MPRKIDAAHAGAKIVVGQHQIVVIFPDGDDGFFCGGEPVRPEPLVGKQRQHQPGLSDRIFDIQNPSRLSGGLLGREGSLHDDYPRN